MTEIYVADAESRDLRNVLRSMVRGAKEGTYVGYRLFIKNIRADHARSKLTFFWNFSEPLVFALVFVFLYKSRVISVGELNIPYAVFVTVGILLWQVFATAITLPLDIIRQSQNLLTHTKVAPESLMWMNIYQVYFDAFFSLVVILSVAIFFGTISLLWFGMFLLFFSSMVLAGFSVGLLLSPVNSIYGDVGKIVNLSLRPLMFISAVIFPLPKTGVLSVLNTVNPMALIISNLRSVLTQGIFINAFAFAITIFIFGLIFLFAWYVFHLSIKVVIERI